MLDFYSFTRVGELGWSCALCFSCAYFVFPGPMKNGTVTIEPKGVKAWLDPSQEPDGVSTRWGWKRDSAWKLGECVWAVRITYPSRSAHSRRRLIFVTPFHLSNTASGIRPPATSSRPTTSSGRGARPPWTALASSRWDRPERSRSWTSSPSTGSRTGGRGRSGSDSLIRRRFISSSHPCSVRRHR